MPILNWIGKDKVVNHHQKVPYRVLEPQYTHGQKDSGNMIIHGDNLDTLKSLLPMYEGKIKCIYIDPPYNTGNEKWVYNDNVNDPKIKKWLGEVVGKEGEDLSRHDKWLCMMYPRLKLLQRLLAEDGAIFISIDDNEQAHLKLICDEIFGNRNFVGQWIWFKSATPPNLSNKIKKNCEYVICYQKTKTNLKYKGIRKYSPSDDPFTKPQNSFKELCFPPNSINIKGKGDFIPKGTYGTKKFPNELLDDLIVESGKNKNTVRFKNRFIWLQNKLDEELANGTVVNLSTNGVLSYKKADYGEEVPPNLIDDAVGVDTTENAGNLLKKIINDVPFEFPKPPSLIEYIVNFLCDKNSIILDSFAGSGTTAHATLSLNRQDNGNRKFILIEMEDYAQTITAERVKRVIDGYADVSGTGGGFTFYELGEPLMFPDGNLNEDIDEEKIYEYVWFTETRAAYAPSGDPYLLGMDNDTAYYFHYEKGSVTSLDIEFLKLIKVKAERYIIYADVCALSHRDLRRYNITFKKIPRDIRRF